MLRGLLSSTLRRDKGNKKNAIQEPDPEEVERERDLLWMNSCEKGRILKELWEHIPNTKGGSALSPTVQKFESTASTSPKQMPSLDWDADNDAEEAFRSQFLTTYEEWSPTTGDDVIPSLFLSHFCSSLHSLVDALAKVDTSMPRGRAPYQYLAVSKTLSCLMVAVRGPLNIRFIIEKGFLLDISKLIEAIVTGLWPLTLPLACLKDSVRCSEEMAKKNETKAGASQDLVRLRDKLSQIQLRISVLSQAMKLVYGCVVEQAQPSPRNTLDGVTSLRIPLTELETSAACVNGQPSIVKVLSWSIVMLNTYVLHAVTNSDLKENDDDPQEEDNSEPKPTSSSEDNSEPKPTSSSEDNSSDILFEIINMMLSIIASTSLGTNSTSLLDSGIPSAICSCLKWPTESIFRHIETDQPISEDCHHDVLKTDYVMFQFPRLHNRRRDQFSEIHQHAIRIATQLLEKNPICIKQFIDLTTGSEANLLDVVSESMVWHVFCYTSKSDDKVVSEHLSEILQVQLVEPNDEFLVDFFNAEIEKSKDGFHGIQHHHNIGDPNLLSQLSGIVAASINSAPLFDYVVENGHRNLGQLFELVTDLSKTANSIRSLAYADALSKIAQDTKQSPPPSDLWTHANLIELISLNVFAPLFLNSSKGPLIQRAQPPPANLIVALNHQRDKYHLQLYCLSCLLQFVKAQEEQDSLRTKRDVVVGKVTGTGIAGYRINGINGQVISVYDVMVQLGVHRILLESEIFYQSSFDTMRGKTVRDPLRYRWQVPSSDEPDGKCFRMLIKQISRLVLSKIATHKSRDIRADVMAVSDMLKQCRYQSNIIIEMGLLLLLVSRQREATTGRLRIASISENDPQVTSCLLSVLAQTFEAQHEIVTGLKNPPAPLSTIPRVLSSLDIQSVDDDDKSVPVGRSVSLDIIGKPACPVPPSALRRRSSKSFCVSDSPQLGVNTVMSSPRTPVSPLKKLFSSPGFGSLDRKVKRGVSSIVLVSSPSTLSPQPTKVSPALSLVSMQSDVTTPAPIPSSVTVDDLPYYMVARNIILNVIETLLELPSVQVMMLSSSYQNYTTLLSCLNDSTLREFGKKQISFLLKQAGEGSDTETLSKILKPPLSRLLMGLTSSTSTVIIISLELIQEVISSLEAEERQQLTTLRIPASSKLPEAGKRRRVIQNMNNDAYVKLTSALHCTKIEDITIKITEENDDSEVCITSHKLATTVVDTIGWLLRGNARAKEQFKIEIGWNTLGDAILQCVNNDPSQQLFDHLFSVLLDVSGDSDGDIDKHHCIKNEDLLVVILKLCFHKSFSSNTSLVLSLMKRVKTILSSSLHNLEKASRVGVLEILVDMLVKWDNRDIRSQIVECYHRVGRHSLTVRQLKPLFAILREQTGPRRTFLLPWVIRILRNLGATQSVESKREERKRVDDGQPGEPLSRGPSAFFDFSGDINSGLKLPDAANYPSTTGYSISMWIRIESFHPPSLHTSLDYTPVLYSLHSESSERDVNSFGAHFVEGRLRLSVRSSGESDSIADVDTCQFETKRWYHILLSHSCGKRIIGKSEARLYVNGVEKWKGPLRYPKPQQQHPYIVTLATDVRGLRQETLLTSLYGQISCVYLIDGLVTSSVVSAIYGLGPDYQSNFAPADREKVVSVLGSESIKALFHEFLSSKIYMLFNPLASQDGMLINIATLNQMDEIHESSTNKDSLAVVLKGSQLCITQSLHQVLESLGGLSVLFPLLALLGEYRHSLFSDENRADSKKDIQLSTDIVPYLISNLLSLLHDLLKLHPLFVIEVQNQRLIHILNMLLRPVGPLLDKSNVERIKILLHKVWNEDTWRDTVMYLLVDMSIWVQSAYSVQMDLFATLYKIVSSDPKLVKNSIGLMYFLDQMTWHLYYETPTVSMEGVRDKDTRERMKGKRGLNCNREIYQVRQEVFRVVQLIMTECPNSDDMQLLNHTLLNPVQDRRQLCDLLDYLLDFWEQKPDSVDQFIKHGGETVLVELVKSDFPPLRQATIRSIGQLLKSKKIREKYEITKPSGLYVIQQGITDKLLDIQTYRAMRDLLLGQIHTPAGGSQAVSESPCRPLPTGSVRRYGIDVPAAINLILRQLSNCSPSDRCVIVQDLITITQGSVENCKLLSTLSISTLLIDVYSDMMSSKDTEGSDLLIIFISQYLYQLLLCLSDGWKHLDILIAASDNYISFDAYEFLVSVFRGIIALLSRDAALGKMGSPGQLVLSNVCYVIVFIEDLLCFYKTVNAAIASSREDETKTETLTAADSSSDQASLIDGNSGLRVSSRSSTPSPQSLQSKVYNEHSELCVVDVTKWFGWDLAYETLQLMFSIGLYKVYEFCKSVDNKDSKFLYKNREMSYFSRQGAIARICTKFIRLCMQHISTTEIDDQKYKLNMNNLLGFTKDIINLDKTSDQNQERFEDIMTTDSKNFQANESKGRTFSLLSMLAEYTQRGHAELKIHSGIDEELLNKVVKTISHIFSERQKVIDYELTGASPRTRINPPPWVTWLRTRTNEPGSLTKFSELFRGVDWQQLNMVMLPVIDKLKKESAEITNPLIHRRRKAWLSEKRLLAGIDQRMSKCIQKLISKASSGTVQMQQQWQWANNMQNTYRDLQRTSEKHWKILVTAVTNERGAWVISQKNSKTSTVKKDKKTFVIRSKQSVGTDLCRIRSKIRKDPKGTDHAGTAANTKGGKIKETDAVKITQHDEVEDDDIVLVDATDLGGEEPPLTGMSAIFQCELIVLMQGWSGTLQITGNPSRSLFVMIDEDNQSIVQATNPASDHLIEKPKDDKYSIDSLESLTLRRYRLRWTAIEFLFTDTVSILLNFPKKGDAAQVFKVILNQIKQPRPKSLKTTDFPKNPIQELKKSRLTEKWLRREISNFEYLMGLNNIASRTYNDLTQYPVMPWVIADYSSTVLDLEDENSFRDLSYPMGCIGIDGKKNDDRVEELTAKHDSLEAIGMTPFHFGSHYSNSGFVLFYLIRLEPFTTGGIVLQGGKFDHADRMFDSIQQTWYGVTHSASDVKELVPEFYYQPEMLINNNSVMFGTRQDGRELGDVELPPWATTPQDFIKQNREALESEYVSLHLNEWIDLIFGHKQQGSAAHEYVNSYHPYSYEQSLRDLEFNKQDEVFQRSMISHIDNFGQTAVQLFKKRHPARQSITQLFNPLRSMPSSLIAQSAIHRVVPGKAIVNIYLTSGERFIAIGSNGVVSIHTFKTNAPATVAEVQVPSPISDSVDLDGTLPVGALPAPKIGRKIFHFEGASNVQSRAIQAGMKKCPVTTGSYIFTSIDFRELLFASGLWNNTATISELVAANTNPVVLQPLFGHYGVITCLALAEDNSHLVTGSVDTTLFLWSLKLKGSSFPLAVQKATLSGHEDAVTCVAISVENDLIASGSADGTAILYNVSEGVYERTLPHPSLLRIDLIEISSCGSIIFYSKTDQHLFLYSCNGKLLEMTDTSSCLNCMTITRDSKYLISGGYGRLQTPVLHLRDAYDLSLLHKFDSPPTPVRSIAIHKDYQVLAAGLEDGSVIFYAVQ